MKKHACQRQYECLRRRLIQLGYISQGSVQDRTARKGGGAGYQWTRKVARKTVSVSLSPDQFVQMKKAISNYRKLAVSSSLTKVPHENSIHLFGPGHPDAGSRQTGWPKAPPSPIKAG